jgi:hypothetical protein
MPFPELEQFKGNNPRLADQISQLELYLTEILKRAIPYAKGLDHAAYDIVPILVAKALDIDEGLALVLLSYFEEANIIVHRYDVYCPTTENFIAKYESKEDLPDHIVCPFEPRTEHSIREYFVELIFNFSPRIARNHQVAVSM